jgi:hypothetical protein
MLKELILQEEKAELARKSGHRGAEINNSNETIIKRAFE